METNKLPVSVAGLVSLILIAILYQTEKPARQLARQEISSIKPEVFTAPVNVDYREYSHPQIFNTLDSTRIVSPKDTLVLRYPVFEQIEMLENATPHEAYSGLLLMLDDTDPVVRFAALEALGSMSYSGISTTLLNVLADSPPLLRIEALEALASQNDVSTIASIESYLFDPNQAVRIAAIDTLAELENEEAVIALTSLLSDDDSLVRHHTVNALGEIGGDNAVIYLLQALYDSDDTIRKNAETILFELGFEGGVDL